MGSGTSVRLSRLRPSLSLTNAITGLSRKSTEPISTLVASAPSGILRKRSLTCRECCLSKVGVGGETWLPLCKFLSEADGLNSTLAVSTVMPSSNLDTLGCHSLWRRCWVSFRCGGGVSDRGLPSFRSNSWSEYQKFTSNSGDRMPNTLTQCLSLWNLHQKNSQIWYLHMLYFYRHMSCLVQNYPTEMLPSRCASLHFLLILNSSQLLKPVWEEPPHQSAHVVFQKKVCCY